MGGLFGPSFDRSSQHASEFMSRADLRHQNMEPASDSNQQGGFHLQDFGNVPKLRMGRITTSLPMLNWYAVKLADCGGDLPCCTIGETGFGAMGVRDTTMLQPGINVWVIVSPTLLTGFILGPIPPRMSDSNLIFSDWIVQGAGCGFRKERYYNDLPPLLSKSTLSNFNGGRPLDATAYGEWGRMAETGLAFHLDAFMAFMRASEMCGIWAFYWDELLRVAGRNLDIRSTGFEITARDDEGECQYVHGDTAYPWEADGVFKFGDKSFRETADKKVVEECIEAKYEPKNDDQIPFFRYEDHGGYLGQGRHRYVVAPPRESGNWRLQDKDKLQGLFSEHISYDGEYGLQSAKGFSLVKRSCIVIPKRTAQAESVGEKGDSKENYKAAGQQGEGPEHKIGDRKIAAGEYPQVMSVATIMDQQAYAFNWKRLHAYYYHKKDFDTPQEDELPKMPKLQETIDFSKLQTDMWLDRPTAKKLKIDHRYKEVEYFQNVAGITVTDDGGVVIFDGYGSTITMTGGNMILAPAGSLLMQPGKSIVTLAGDDICLRAGKSVDISAGEKDVRIKAEKNMQFLSGNGGQGGMLFDCRSEGNSQQYQGKVGEDVQSNGIVFKAENSGIAALGQSVYVRSLSNDLVLDANKGKANLVLIGQNIMNYADSNIMHFFGFDATQAANVFQESGTLFSAQVGVMGTLLIDGQIDCTGGAAILGGVGAEEGPTMIGKLDGQAISAVQDGASQLSTSESAAVTTASTYRNAALEQEVYTEQKPGSESFRKQAQFSYRTEQQYGTTRFALPLTAWQQLAKGHGGVPWNEPYVTYQGEQQLPWPGKKKWADEATLFGTTLLLYDVDAGADKARPGPYEQASQTPGTWQKSVPITDYLIIPSN